MNERLSDFESQTLDNLVFMLKRSFDRSGVFYIGLLDELHHQEIADLLGRKLAPAAIGVECLHFNGAAPLGQIRQRLTEARDRQERVVLALWSLEHLPEPALHRLLRDFCAGREWFSQTPQLGRTTVPLVLLVSSISYRQMATDAMDLLDGVPVFKLSEN
ncbi:MAG: hypothetical protein JW892_16795 [Anaerolineae bacterium]|nr:hypothetical protein [Anaerolineae bacterium]